MTPQKETTVSFYQSAAKIYPREVHGRYARLRVLAMFALLGFYYLVPWISWDGVPLVLFDLPARRFHVFGLTLVPQDFYLLTAMLAMAAAQLGFVRFPDHRGLLEHEAHARRDALVDHRIVAVEAADVASTDPWSARLLLSGHAEQARDPGRWAGAPRSGSPATAGPGLTPLVSGHRLSLRPPTPDRRSVIRRRYVDDISLTVASQGPSSRRPDSPTGDSPDPLSRMPDSGSCGRKTGHVRCRR